MLGLAPDPFASYLIKPSDASWEDGIVALEAGMCHVYLILRILALTWYGGSGKGALSRLLSQRPGLFAFDSDSSRNKTPRVYSANEIYSFVQ